MHTSSPGILRVRAFAVHLFTASGAFWALLALICAAERNWVGMFSWLGVALLVDGIDGPLARLAAVEEVLPNWSGKTLDSIIDYSTYVLIPAFALHGSGLMETPLSLIASALIVVSSAVYYADTRMKLEDNYFRGFPVVWNMVFFTLFVVEPNQWTTFSLILFITVATFLPVKFLHPVRVSCLRPLNLFIFGLWGVFGLVALVAEFATPAWAKVGLLSAGIYLCGFGAVVQILQKLGSKAPVLGN
jgi:phosphatidylcholine synthase